MDYFKQNIKSLALSLIVFFVLVFVIDWPFFVGAGLAIGLFGGSFLIFTPKIIIGNVELENIENAKELKEIYDNSKALVASIKKNGGSVKDSSIRISSLKLASIAEDIIAYLEDKPKDISTSRHFLTYYLSTADKIVKNYNELDRANVSFDKFESIRENTEKSLRLLRQIFTNQRDSYHKEAINDLNIETDLLEKTVRLGGE